MKLTNHLSTLLIFVFLLLQNPFSFAQFGTERGTIITLQGDTLVGKIKSATPLQLSKEVTFISEDSSITYRADEIQGFFFRDGETFVAHHVQFSTKKKNFDEPRFLRLMEKGKINLYLLDDRKAHPLFIQKENDVIQLLCISEKGEKDYLKILQTEMSDCEELANLEIKKLHKRSVQSLVEKYNVCSGILPKPQLTSQVYGWGFGGLPFEYWNDGYEGTSFGGLIGTDLSFFKRQISVEFGVQIYRGKKEGERNVNISDTFLKLNYNFMHRQFLSPYVSAGINVMPVKNGEWLKPYVGGGFTVNFGRHFIRTEVSYPYLPNLKVGYGIRFIK